jgi:hypothetical protein
VQAVVVMVQTQQHFNPLRELPIQAVEVAGVELVELLVRQAAQVLSSFVTLLTALLLLLQLAHPKSTTLMATKSTLGHHLEL